MSQDKQGGEGEERTVSRQQFRADPDRYILAAEQDGPIAVLDDHGRTRMVLSSPLANDEKSAAE